MAQWSNAVVTLAGVEMLNQVVEGKRLILDYAAGGSGVVDVASLLLQSGLKNQKQQFEIVGVSKAESGRKIHVMIINTELAQGYTLNQLGIWAHIDEAAPRLLCILQDSEGIKIPAASELLDFALDFYAAIAISSDAQIELSVDPSALVSLSTLQEALEDYVQLDSAGKIPDDVLPDMDFIPKTARGQAGGVASLNTSGKIPIEQLAIDTALSATSGNPVQNKVVQEAFNNLSNAMSNSVTSINNALSGKAASNHSHTLASLGAAAANHGHSLASLGAAAANHGHDIASLGGCRIVTGIYTGNGAQRLVVQDTPLRTLTGGQFINLGAKPRLVIVVQFSHQSGYSFASSYNAEFSVDKIREFFNSSDWKWMEPGEGTSTGGVGIDIVDSGFYVGKNYVSSNWAIGTNSNNYKYAYVAII